MGLDVRKPDFDVCKQEKHQTACSSAQIDQCLCYLLSGKYLNRPCSMPNFKFLDYSLCS